MKNKIRSVSSIAASVRKVLKSEGLYTPIYEMSINDLAQTTHLKEIAFQDAIKYDYPEIDDVNRNANGRSILVEQSREGFLRYKVNPAYSIYVDLVRESQKILDGMCMTAKSTNSIQDDDFDELREKMQMAADGR